MRRGDGWRPSGCHRELGRDAHDAVRRRVFADRRALGRRVGASPGDDESREHRVRGEAPDGAQVRGRRGPAPPADVPVRGRRGGERRCLRARARSRLLAARSVGARAREDAPDRRGLARRASHRGRGHGAGVLRRRSTPGDERRRSARRAHRPAHRQRADRRRARVRRRDARRGARGRVRPRRWHVRRLDLGARRRRVPRAVDRRRYVPRRRGLRQRDRRALARHVPSAERGHGSTRRSHGVAAAKGGRRARQDRAVVELRHRDQPAVHRRGAGWSAPLADVVRARRAGDARRAARARHARAVPARDRGCRDDGGLDRCRDPRRRPDAHAAHPGAGHRDVRQRGEPPRESRRGRRGRRGDLKPAC